MSNMCNSIQQCQSRSSEETISYQPCSRLCNTYHTYSDPARTVCINNNNDPLQDYIRRCFAAQGYSSNQNCHGRVVYSTFSTERHIPVIRRKSIERYISNSHFDGTTRRPYIILPSQIRHNTSAYQPYLRPKRPKYVFINSNGLIKSQVEKKQDHAEGGISSQKRINNNFERLDFIEQYIAHNTNQFGYVTLNETILKQLSTAISECLSKIIPVNETKCEPIYEPIYEPISPAENSDDNEDD